MPTKKRSEAYKQRKREYLKQYRVNKKAEISAQKKAYYQANKQQIKAYKKIYRQRNRFALMAENKAYRADLRNGYVFKLIKQSNPYLSASVLIQHPELVELERIKIKLNRTLKQQQHGQLES
ncbi:MAG: hypothetical protein U0Y10_17625 [Spirosomataceae bacterium]